MNFFDIKGKVAFITGGNRGLGRSMAEGLAEAGVNLFMIATNEESLEKACTDITKRYGIVCGCQKADITDENAVIYAVKKCIKSFVKSIYLSIMQVPIESILNRKTIRLSSGGK